MLGIVKKLLFRGRNKRSKIDKWNFYQSSEMTGISPITPRSAHFDSNDMMVCPGCGRKRKVGDGELKLIESSKDPYIFNCSFCNCYHQVDRDTIRQLIKKRASLSITQSQYTPIHDCPDIEYPLKAELNSDGKFICPQCGQLFLSTPSIDLLQSYGDRMQFICERCGCNMSYR